MKKIIKNTLVLGALAVPTILGTTNVVSNINEPNIKQNIEEDDVLQTQKVNLDDNLEIVYDETDISESESGIDSSYKVRIWIKPIVETGSIPDGGILNILPNKENAGEYNQFTKNAIFNEVISEETMVKSFHMSEIDFNDDGTRTLMREFNQGLKPSKLIVNFKYSYVLDGETREGIFNHTFNPTFRTSENSDVVDFAAPTYENKLENKFYSPEEAAKLDIDPGVYLKQGSKIIINNESKELDFKAFAPTSNDYVILSTYFDSAIAMEDNDGEIVPFLITDSFIEINTDEEFDTPIETDNYLINLTSDKLEIEITKDMQYVLDEYDGDYSEFKKIHDFTMVALSNLELIEASNKNEEEPVVTGFTPLVSSNNSSSNGLSVWTIVGISVGSVAGATAIIGGAYLFIKSKKNKIK